MQSNAQEKFVAARRILKKGDDVYIGVHKEFFFKSNTAAADFNKRINRSGCHLSRFRLRADSSAGC